VRLLGVRVAGFEDADPPAPPAPRAPAGQLALPL
jgi:DNA polymerase-4